MACRPKRARLLVVPLCLLAAGLLAACGEPPPRNVLLIIVDTLRADHLGVYGYDRPTSPELDRWAEGAVVFEHAFSTSPWTVPAIGSILTGRLPGGHGAGRQIEGSTWHDRTPIDSRIEDVVGLLRSRGFATWGIVSNPFLEQQFGVASGFGTYRHYGRRLGAPFAVDRALEWLGEAGDAPFFMMLHFLEPHLPYEPPEPFRGRFTGDDRSRKLRPLDELLASSEEVIAEEREFFTARYDEEIAFLDSELGRLFAGLGERWGDTIVVLTSDHGEEFLEHGGFQHGHSMMNELLHVPWLLWAPGLEAARIETAVSLADVSPTLLDGLDLDADLLGAGREGRSVWGLARGERRERPRPLYAEQLLYGDERKALIAWPHKLILDLSSGERRLFDLASDPHELEDVSDERPELADRLEGEIRRRLVNAVGAGERHRPSAIDEQTRRELQALGYVE